MVAYSFKKRFAAPILAGTKAQTIRADRKRHARPGEQLQLYTGMRTKHCKLVGRPKCIEVLPVRFCFSKRAVAELMQVGDRYLIGDQMDAFAGADGFASIEDMIRFWWSEHPPEGGNVLTFGGVLIRWTPLAAADALDIGAAA